MPRRAESRCPAPRRGVRAIESSCGEIPWSLRLLVEHDLNPDTGAAFLEPAVGLLVDGLLHQRFLDKVPRILQCRRSLAARFRVRHDAGPVKVLDGLFVNLDSRAEAGVEVIAEMELGAEEPANFLIGDAALFLTRLKFLGGGKRTLQAFEAAVDVVRRRLGKPRHTRLVADDPLVDQAVQDVRVALRFAVQEDLVTVELPDVAQQDDIGFAPGGNPVNHFLSLAKAWQSNEADKHRRDCDPFTHQKLEPRLKNI